MIPVTCKTNLDLHHSEQWPTELPAVPNVGDYIVSARKWGVFQLRLKVVSVTWASVTVNRTTGKQEWIPVVEMHDAWVQPRSINEFQKWYEQCQKQ